MKIFNIIKEEILKINNFSIKINENYRQINLFSIIINEKVDQKIDTTFALKKIKNGEFEIPQNPESFKNSLNNSKHKDMLTDYSVNELSKMRLFKLNGMDIGFALKKFEDKGFCEIVAVHNNELEVKGIGEELIKSAIQHGGLYLDHFDGMLSNLYGKLGFVEYKRDKYNPQYDTDATFKNKYGEQDVIYRLYKK